MYATTQAVSAAIARSIRTGGFEYLDAGRHFDAICEELSDLCDGQGEEEDGREFWGKNEDGDAWRVRVY